MSIFNHLHICIIFKRYEADDAADLAGKSVSGASAQLLDCNRSLLYVKLQRVANYRYLAR